MSEPTPVRLQLSRRKGFNLQALSRAINGLEAVSCARPSKRGNPFRAVNGVTKETCVQQFVTRIQAPNQAKELADIKDELRGKNLACWCRLCDRHRDTGLPLGMECQACEPCHTMPLMEIANR